jgi:hypothetical protein
MNGRAWITRSQDAVRAMTVRAYRNMLVTLCSFRSMNTSVIERELVGSEGWVKGFHAIAIRMAGTAQLGDLRTRDVAAEAASGRLGTRLVFGVTAMARGTTHAFVTVDTAGTLVYDDLQVALQLGVTVDANILRRLGHKARRQPGETNQHPTKMRARNLHLLSAYLDTYPTTLMDAR